MATRSGTVKQQPLIIEIILKSKLQSLTWVSSNSPTLAVGASKLEIYPMLCA